MYGNTLHVIDQDDQVRSYVIEDYDLWRLLLVKRPNDIGLKLKNSRGDNTATLDEYIRIADDLHLINTARKYYIQFKNRAKYKLLPKNVVGQGFLFTSKKNKMFEVISYIHLLLWFLQINMVYLEPEL